MKRVAIVDFDMGNLFSVVQACERARMEPLIVRNPDEIQRADGLLLPGVGAFGAAMDHLNATGLAEAICNFVRAGKPFFGICLGMQLLLTKSAEFGDHAGLGLVPGKVVRFPTGSEKVPQVGWNQIKVHQEADAENWIRGSLSNGDYMYFVHSYYAVPDDPRVALTTTEYQGIEYCSALRSGNMIATQFHPEKSGSGGLAIYEAWSHIL